MEPVHSALNKAAVEYAYYPKEYIYDIERFLYRECLQKLRRLLKSILLNKHRNLKVQLTMQVELSKYKDGEKITIEPNFNSTSFSLLTRHDIVNKLFRAFGEVTASFDAFVSGGSGWSIERIMLLKASTAKYTPLRGGCSGYTIPPAIARKHAIVSVKCKDDKCFLYSILAHLYPVELVQLIGE